MTITEEYYLLVLLLGGFLLSYFNTITRVANTFVTPLGASGDVFGASEFRHNLGMLEDLIVGAGSLEWLYWSFGGFIVDQSSSRVWSSHDMERQKV